MPWENRLRRLFGRASIDAINRPRPRSVVSLADSSEGDAPEPQPSLAEHAVLQSLGVNNLWGEAYRHLRKENEELLSFYELSLLEETDQQKFDRQTQLEALVKRKLEDVMNRQWSVTFGGKVVVVSDQVQRIVKMVISAKDVISASIAAEPHAAVAWAGILVILPLLVNPVKQGEDAAEGLEAISDLLVRCRFIETVHVQTFNVNSRNTDEHQKLAFSVRGKTIDLYCNILKYQILVAKQYSRSGIFRYLRDLTMADDWGGMLIKIQGLKTSINEDLEALSRGTVDEIDLRVKMLQDGQQEILEKLLKTSNGIENVHQLELLNTLNTASRATFKGYEEGSKSRCLEGTQLQVLDRIQVWSKNPTSEPLLWLQGMAGTGKSTIARTVSSAFYERRSLTNNRPLADEVCLGASFFFNRTDAQRNNARQFFPTLARQLVETLPHLREYVSEAIEKHHDIGSQVLANQWKELILMPLMKLGKRHLSRLTVIIVVDALDECQCSSHTQENDVSVLLSLLPEARDLGSVGLKAFITSRSDWTVVSNFAAMPQVYHCDVMLSKIAISDDHSHLQMDDIILFVKNELLTIRGIHGLPDGWPGEKKIRRMVKKSEGLFIYASTACLFLQGNRKMKHAIVNGRLDKLLSDTPGGNGAQTSLDNMYTDILQASVLPDADDDELQQISDDFKYIVGSIVNLSEPLPIFVSTLLLGTTVETANIILGALHSVLTVPFAPSEPVKLLHLSFRDYLLDETRCRDDNFRIHERKSHRTLFNRCLDTMSKTLRRDVCNLHRPNIRAKDISSSVVAQSLPLHIQYSCCYWVDHLLMSDIVLSDEDNLLEFLSHHLMHWIEAMGILGKISLCSRMINDLGDRLRRTRVNEVPLVRNIIDNAQRLLSVSGSIVEEAPLQTYISALLFAPSDSVIRGLYKHEIPEWIFHHPSRKGWSPLLKELNLPNWLPIEFSPDGKLLVIESRGEFSNRAQAWDTVTWTCMAEFSLNRVGSLENIKTSFSPDGSMLAYPAPRGTINVLHLSTLQTESLAGKDESTLIVLFSPNAEFIASVTRDAAIQVFNVRHGELSYTRRGDFTKARSMQFSPDNSTLIVNHDTDFHTLWDVQTGTMRQAIRGLGEHILAFIPGQTGWRTMTSSGDLATWDQGTAMVASTQRLGPDQYRGAMAFSPDGDMLAVIPKRTQLRLEVWDTSTATLISTTVCEEHWTSGPKERISWVPGPTGWRVLVELKRKYLWDVQSESWCKWMQPRFSFNIFCFSPDGSRIVLNGPRDMCYIWEVDDGRPIGGHSGPEGAISTLEMSSNILAISRRNPCSLQLIQTFGGKLFKESITSLSDGSSGIRLSLSADGHRAAFGSYQDVNIQLMVWDFHHGEVFSTVLPPMWTCGISPDGSLIATAGGTWDGNHVKVLAHRVEIWNIETGKVVAVLVDDGEVVSVCPYRPVISTDNQLIAWSYGHRNMDIQIRQLRTRKQLHHIRHGSSVEDLAFSLSGHLLAAAGKESTGLYDVDTGTMVGKVAVPDIVTIRYSPDSKYLHTNKGRFQLALLLGGPGPNSLEALKGDGLYVYGNWLVESGEELVLLPPEYRTPHTSTRGNVIALGSWDETVVTMGFTDGAKSEI